MSTSVERPAAFPTSFPAGAPPVRSWRDRLAPWAVNVSLLLMALLLGGGLYETIVVDTAWPANVSVIQPSQGGVDRKPFWILVHAPLTIALPIALWACWRRPGVRGWLLAGTGIYVAIRVWSFLYFIPLALKFEGARGMADPLMSEASAWVRLSPIRCALALAGVAALWLAAVALRPAKRAYKGVGMEGLLARWYAKNTGKHKESYRETAQMVAAQVANGGSVLEVAPGPGYLAIELAKLGDYRVVGLDISQSFVEMARRNAREAGVAVTFEWGNAACMPFGSDSFDVIVCRAAFKNFAEPVQALTEMHRVLRPGGKALIYDLRPDAPPEAIGAEIKKMGLGWFDAMLTKLAFKYMLLKRAYSREQLREMASQSAFGTCEIRADGIGFAVSFVKPEIGGGLAGRSPSRA
jgi:ubiquinone/menaquinone biosynthesis C-methylase UbiE